MASTSAALVGHATVHAAGDTRLIATLHDDLSQQLHTRGQVAATVAVAGIDDGFSTVIEPDGLRGHWINLPADCEVTAGDELEITITVADDWPEPTLHPDFAAVLADDPELHSLWESLTPRARWEWMRWIHATKNETTVQKRIMVGVDKLRKGKRRPCCFDLSSCTDPRLAVSGKLRLPHSL